MTVSSRIAIVALVALATTVAAAPALARVPWNPTHSSDACRPDIGEALQARGDHVNGFDLQRGGFGRLATDIVIECLGDYRTQVPF
jgi:hypothetical protein